MKKTVALVFGGEGAERSISEASAQNLASLIDTDSYELMLVGISESGNWYIYRGPYTNLKDGAWLNDKANLKTTYPVRLGGVSGFLSDGKLISVSCAIPCLHGDFGEDGVVQGALTAAHINYIGQDVYASAITGDKVYTKLAAEHLKIPCAKWLLSAFSDPDSARAAAERQLKYPIFLKPARLGSSYGAHPVYQKADFEGAYTDARAYGEKILIEELVDVAYELECAFLERDGILLAPYGKITTDGKFYGYGEKYSSVGNISTAVSEDTVDDKIKNRILCYSENLVRFLGLKYLSRIDFFVTKRGEVYFNEINTFPGMTDSSLYPALTETMGLQKGDFINLLIGSSIK